MTRILAVDPGTHESGIVWYEPHTRRVRPIGVLPNAEALEAIAKAHTLEWSRAEADLLAVEMIASYGMPVGAEVFETCVWIGRFVEAWIGRHRLVYRREVKLHLCGSSRAKDPNVRQALLDRFGPGRKAAMGVKAHPGPLYGIRSHMWAALGVAITASETL